jgi:hypothetical protein
VGNLVGHIVVQSARDSSGNSIAAVGPGISFGVDGGGAVPATGILGDIYVPVGIQIGSPWVLLADQAGDMVLDLWVDTYANFPPTIADTITAAAKPTLAGALRGTGATNTWSINISAGSVIRVNLDSIAVITRFAFFVPVSLN